MDSACRRILSVSLAGLLLEIGFQFSNNIAHETLVEIMLSLIRQIGLSSHRFCEQAGRVQPVVGDVVMALIDIGICPHHIESYAKRNGMIVLSPILKVSHPKRVNNLHVGKEEPRPGHIPDYFPGFPDPHTYLRTPTLRKPAIEYDVLREKASFQQQCIKKALTKFVARTSDTESYFSSADKNIFPLIPCQTHNPAYLTALLTSDQLFQFQDEFFVPKRKIKGQSPDKKPIKYMVVQENNQDQTYGPNAEPIDNPYLHPVKIKLLRKKRQRKCNEKLKMC
ncbi:hypothetical protein L9F63_010052 [Diploptera punctata]|uniref:Transcription initiation factor TFIID subunit 8 n=1 Tax=Diploptera punctata TaxID=6984 RepID=A0AAD8AI07_DIPPU|nr:hypothetical protein L9F63_010052 [Diploptera punctata]